MSIHWGGIITTSTKYVCSVHRGSVDRSQFSCASTMICERWNARGGVREGENYAAPVVVPTQAQAPEIAMRLVSSTISSTVTSVFAPPPPACISISTSATRCDISSVSFFLAASRSRLPGRRACAQPAFVCPLASPSDVRFRFLFDLVSY